MFGNWLETTILMAGIVALFGVGGGVRGLLGTHPDTGERIARLRGRVIHRSGSLHPAPSVGCGISP